MRVEIGGSGLRQAGIAPRLGGGGLAARNQAAICTLEETALVLADDWLAEAF